MQFELRSNGSNLHSNASNPVLMVGILFECLESRSNGWNLHSNPVRMIRICIQMVQIPFECLEFAFECFETRSNGWNLHSSASNTVQNGGICIKCFESHSNGWNWHSNASNPDLLLELAFEWFKSCLGISIQMVRISFDLGKYFSKVLATQFLQFKKFSWPSARFCDSVT